MRSALLVVALPMLLMAGALSGCLEEKVEFGDLDDRFRGALGGTADSAATPETADEPLEAQPEAQAPATQTQTQTAAPAEPAEPAEPEEPEPAPVQARATGPCNARVDPSGSVVGWTSKNAASRINSKEGIVMEFTLGNNVVDYGLATTAISSDTICNLDDSTVKYWQGWSKREGTDQYGDMFPGDSGASSSIYQSVAGWYTHQQDMEDWPSASGPDHRVFRYFAYARTTDGTLHYTPIADATEGKGLIGVYYRHKIGRFYMEDSELAHEDDF